MLVKKRSKPLADIPPARFGTKPADGGNLIVEVDEYLEVAADPIAGKYLHPFRMGRELVQGLDRWCLWMADKGFEPADLSKSAVLKDRVEKCKAFREQSSPNGDAFKLKDVPHLMRPNPNRPKVPYVAIPRVVSGARKFYAADHLPPDVIAADSVYTALDPDGLLFALVSSSMFLAWQRTVGGRLKSDLRFSNTLVWNTFPVPELDAKARQRIIDAGKKVLDARALHPERSLAEHYNPLAMAPELLKAHDDLDREVDKAFGAPRKLTTERQRQELLFANYVALTEKD